MSNILDEDLEFSGGTLQLSTDHVANENTVQLGTATDSSGSKQKNNANPSVLSGADSLSSSTASFIDARTEEQDQQNATGADPANTVFPRYDVPFNRENIKDFFSFRKGVVENAIQECITTLLFPEDGEYLGCWLLTEQVCEAVGELEGRDGADVYCMDQCIVYPPRCPRNRCRCY